MVCERLEQSFKRRIAVGYKQQSPARLAQSADRKAINFVVVVSIPTVGDLGGSPIRRVGGGRLIDEPAGLC